MSTDTAKGVFRMPSLGADMESGTLIEWSKQPGDAFRKGDVIAVVETQKGAIEVEVFQDGVLSRTLVEPGETVPVGTVMAELEEVGAAHGPAETAVPSEKKVPGPVPEMQRPAAQPSPRPPPPRASPVARRLATERGIDLSTLTGSGPTGAITLGDVQTATEKVTQPKPTGKHPNARGRLDLAAMREAIAAAMRRSKREIPHYYLAHDIDLTPAADWLARRNAELPPERRILMGVLFIKAVALTLRDFPELNGFDRDGRFEPGPGIHVGTAIAIRGGGLIAPAIHDADRLDLQTLMDRLRDLVARVRAGTLRSSELSDPTVTVSSLGERGVDRLYGVIYPPQVAIVGFGTPVRRPWIHDDRVVPRLIVSATLAVDHRHSDGHRGGLFLARLANLLQEPDSL